MHKRIFCALVFVVLLCSSAWAEANISVNAFSDDNFRQYISNNFDTGYYNVFAALEGDEDYIYTFDLRNIVSDDTLSRIDRSSIIVYGEDGSSIEYLLEDWIIQCKEPPAEIRYRQNTGDSDTRMTVILDIDTTKIIVKPQITVTSDDVPEGEQGQYYSFDVGVTGTGPFYWEIVSGYLPGGLTLDRNTGRISGTPTETGTFTVRIRVTDNVYSVYITITIIIRAGTSQLVITPPTNIPAGSIDVEYSITFTATGTGTLTWSLEDAPSWISINSSTGVLSGTPTENGTFSFWVVVTSSPSGQTARYRLTITVGSDSTTGGGLTFSTTRIDSGTINVSYTFTFQASGTGTLTWQIISGALPSGLTLNSRTGVISGIPTESGSFTFTVRVTDSGGSQITRTFTLYISSGSDSGSPIIAGGVLPEGIVDVSYTYQLTATGATPMTWSIISGSLPPGLSMNTAGRITGRPTTAGTYRFTVRVENNVGYYELELAIVIHASGTTSGDGIPPDIIAAFTLRNGYVGTSYSVSLYAEGTRAIRWNLTNGSLPPGLRLNSGGTITGVPTVAGEYTFTVEAVNDWGSDFAMFIIYVYNDSGTNDTDGDGTGIIYEYTRTINSLTQYELVYLPSNLYIIASVLPRFRITTAGTYRFAVNIYDTVPAGLNLVWFPFQINGSASGIARFFDLHGTEITKSQNIRRLVVSVYLDVGTYEPVVAAVRPEEPEKSPDVKPNSGGSSGGGGGGCSVSSGALGLTLLAGMLLLRKGEA